MIWQKPIFVVRSGFVDINIPRLGGSGIYGYGWSSRANADVRNAYDLHFNKSAINASNLNTRYTGYPLRCLARQ